MSDEACALIIILIGATMRLAWRCVNGQFFGDDIDFVFALFGESGTAQANRFSQVTLGVDISDVEVTSSHIFYFDFLPPAFRTAVSPSFRE